MPQPCTICTHPNRSDIDHLIVEGAPNRRVAARFDVSEASIRRHRASHLPKALVKAKEIEEVAQADSLMTEIHNARSRSEKLYAAAERILDVALEAQDSRTALQSIRAAVTVMKEARGHTELKGKLTGELGRGGQEARETAVIILPARVPPGTVSPLRMEIPEDAIERALAEHRDEVIEVEAQEVESESLRPAP